MGHDGNALAILSEPPPALAPVANLFLRVAGNVLAQPREKKFRRLRRQSRAFASALAHTADSARAEAALCEALQAFGWEITDDEFVLPDDAHLLHVEALRNTVWVAAHSTPNGALPSSTLSWILPFLQLREVCRTANVSRRWCAEHPASLRSMFGMSDSTSAARVVSLSLTGVGFFAHCGPLEPDANPLTDFDNRVRVGCVAGGDMRIARPDARWRSGFGQAEFRDMVSLPRTLRVIGANGRCSERPEPPAQTNEFWASVLCALRTARWQSAHGASWAWSERGSWEGRAGLLFCQRICWMFLSPSDGARWQVVVQVEQSMRPDR